MSAPRAVSLLSSATEIAAALGLGDRLVGRSHECDWPDWVSELPVCSTPVIDIAAKSADIDRSVRELIEDALSVYRVDGEALAALAPDVILTQTQCEVCAVSPRDVAAAVASVTGVTARVVSLQPAALEDLWRDVATVAAALGAPELAPPLVARLKGRIAAIATAAAARPHRPRLACIEWIDPLMAAGNWMPELVALAGGHNLFGEAGRHSPWLDLDALVASDPDAILVMPCGFDLPRTLAELPALSGRDQWRGLRAVREGRAFAADGNRYFNRPGPRLVESLEIIAEILHPAAFDFGHRGDGWVALVS